MATRLFAPITFVWVRCDNDRWPAQVHRKTDFDLTGLFDFRGAICVQFFDAFHCVALVRPADCTPLNFSEDFLSVLLTSPMREQFTQRQKQVASLRIRSVALKRGSNRSAQWMTQQLLNQRTRSSTRQAIRSSQREPSLARSFLLIKCIFSSKCTLSCFAFL